mmetsp:Transcript_91889/g.180074  ORF Transcript_91889/g.180074 Transcript_91889/m.180074 type:complete len:151 (+) Transcript_91889:115-567(+)|eukprot:CAMPEP_0170368828 /NCGR_PEP_ID=MMETSP0117_2-20130122/7660_1 /TAXON_ID=400756 /ORGANISM="Durinskia baltica, Strain CSIRO CS-38" /LENGTH=150 /DNA_ID=CAMNT_0010623511 /DNA_START=89 /DNA_END=541 /DNA_ORIENTATION=+
MSATIEEDENANELQFGNINFEEVETLTNDEMYLVLVKRHNAGVSNELFDQTFAYVERVATTKINHDVEALTLDLRQKLGYLTLQRVGDGKRIPLHKYEISCLANFIKDDDTSVDEILSLVPSMSRFPVDQIEIAINIVTEAKERAGSGL